MMILTIDNLAERYKMMPSEVLNRANTFDLYVLDVSSKWLKYQHEEMERQRSGAGKVKSKTPKLTQEQMIAMINAVKERKK